MSSLYGNEVTLGEKTLDLLWQRQNVTAMNIANVDTPNYKSQYVTFEAELANRIHEGRLGYNTRERIDKAISRTRGSVYTTTNESSRLDGNNVDMDQEQVDLVKTTYEYQMMVNSVSGDLKRLDSAAKSF